MTIYITKVWGFGLPVGPLQFGDAARRRTAIGLLQPGDTVVLVGTKDAPTNELEQGRLLGIIEPSTEPVMSLDFDIPTQPHDFVGDEYKWPYGLLSRRAWRLIDRPLLEEISPRRFNMDAASGIVPLLADEERRVEQLRREEVPLLPLSLRAQARLEGANALRRRTSPPPTTTRRGVMHLRREKAYTYALALMDGTRRTGAFKIGWTFDTRRRMRQFNQAAMPGLGGLGYEMELAELWSTARDAYRMEQSVLKHFNRSRHIDNHEIIHGVDRNELLQYWLTLIRRS